MKKCAFALVVLFGSETHFETALPVVCANVILLALQGGLRAHELGSSWMKLRQELPPLMAILSIRPDQSSSEVNPTPLPALSVFLIMGALGPQHQLFISTCIFYLQCRHSLRLWKWLQLLPHSSLSASLEDLQLSLILRIDSKCLLSFLQKKTAV